MSDKTRDALDEAIRAHIQDEEDGDAAVYVTEWVLSVATTVPGDMDSTAYWYYDNNVPHHHALGLIAVADKYLRADRDEDGD